MRRLRSRLCNAGDDRGAGRRNSGIIPETSAGPPAWTSPKLVGVVRVPDAGSFAFEADPVCDPSAGSMIFFQAPPKAPPQIETARSWVSIWMNS